MRAAVIALLSFVAFAGIGAIAVSLLPSADSAPLHPIQVNAPALEPVAPATPTPAATPPPGPPSPAPRTQANLRDIPEPPPPLIHHDDDGDDDYGDDYGDDDWDDGDDDDD